MLAARPRAAAADLEGAVTESLHWAAAVLGTTTVALMLEDNDEPWVDLAVWDNGVVRRQRVPSGDGAGLTDAFHPPGGSRRAVAVPVRSDYFDATLLAGADGLAQDDLALVQAVGDGIAEMLERIYRERAVREAALIEERTRLARELHDGVVQSLTSASLRLKAAEQVLGADAAAALEHVRAVQQLLAEEQRDLRAYVVDLKPRALEISGGQANVDLWLRDLARRIGNAWDIGITVTSDVREPLPTPLAHGVYRIAQEAMVNSARHGHAAHAVVELRQSGQQLTLVIADDGRSFTFRGTFEHADLIAQRLGPVNLKERVLELRGTLRIISGDTGARLEVTLPLEAAP